jgi:hypothetical protein
MLRANNEVMRLLFASYTFATEVVLFEKLGKNEVFATSFFSSIFGRKISYLLNTLPYRKSQYSAAELGEANRNELIQNIDNEHNVNCGRW